MSVVSGERRGAGVNRVLCCSGWCACGRNECRSVVPARWAASRLALEWDRAARLLSGEPGPDAGRQMSMAKSDRP
jgi:hypothetical protein